VFRKRVRPWVRPLRVTAEAKRSRSGDRSYQTRLAAIGANRVRVPTPGVAGFRDAEGSHQTRLAAIGANRVRVPTPGVAGFRDAEGSHQTRLAAIGCGACSCPDTGRRRLRDAEGSHQTRLAAIGADRVRVPTPDVAGFETLKAPTRARSSRAPHPLEHGRDFEELRLGEGTAHHRQTDGQPLDAPHRQRDVRITRDRPIG